MIVGYCRVSTKDQNLDRQIHALSKAGCEHVYQDKLSGKNTDRPELQVCLQSLRAGDTLIVQKLDRLARSLKDLIEIIEDLGARKVNFICIDNKIDTTTPAGKLMFQLIGAIAEFERSLIVSRVQDGIENAKRNGVRFGRRFSLLDQKRMEALYVAWKDQGDGARKLSEDFNVPIRAVYRWIEDFKEGVTVAEMFPSEEPKSAKTIYKEI